MNPIHILLADDHAVLRAGLAALLNTRPDMKVVGEAADGVEVLGLALQLKPDVILLDLTMPRLGGLEVLPLLHQQLPEAKLLILTMHDDEGYLRQALKAGASGYVLKKAADVELISAILAVMQGNIYVHPSMTKALLQDVLPPSWSDPQQGWVSLSEREQAVLRYVGLGYTGREIADQLSLSIKTVETYRSRGMEKLGLRSRAQLVQFMQNKQLLKPIE